jgi:outer membrane protein assembly complex protein YaeT
MVTKLLTGTYDIMRLVRPPLACCCAFLLIAALQSAKLIAQTSQFEGKNIVGILFDPPDQPLDKRELAQIVPLQTGQPLQMSTVRATIERLYATGHYEDIQVDAEPDADGVTIKFITRNSWFIGNVSIRGNITSSPNPGQLVNASRLELGQPYNESKLDDAIANQKRLLEANGLFLASVHPVFDYDTVHQQINIRFVVDRGRRARFGPPNLQGDLRLPEERIIRATRFRRIFFHTWKPMTQTRVRQGVDGVRALYQHEDRLEAKVALEGVAYDKATNTATPTLQIDAGPRIKINTVGYSLARRHLKRLVPVFEEHAVDNDLLTEGARNIRDYLQSNGFFEAQVEFKRQNVVNDQAVIDYLINTGRRHRLAAITFRGNEYFKTSVLRERMYLQPASFLQFPHGRFSEGLMKRDIQAITNLYESNGFRDVKVTATPEDNYRGKEGDILVAFVINEGPQYFINALQIDGVEKLDKNKFLKKLTSIEGQPFSEFNVAVDRDTILAQYSENGFPNATFEWNSKPAAERYKIDVFFVIHEGDQQFVRGVVVNPSGLRATRSRLVWRTIQVGAGDPLSPTAITNTQRRLYDLGVFAKVDAAVQNPEGETNRKFVLFDLEEAARYSMAIGVGAELGRIGGCQTCLDAPAGATGFSPRVSFDITRNNLWGVGHRLSLQTRFSTLEQLALLAYTWPRFRNNSSLTLSFTLVYQSSKDVRTFTYQREEGSVQLSQRLSKASTLLYRFAYRRVAVSNLKISPLLIPLFSQPVRVGIASVTWVQDKRDDPVDPHRGIFNTVDFGLADRIFGSQPNFLRFLARNATYHPIGRKVVFARNTQVGEIYALTGDQNTAIPLAERFFGGGANSHRGFADYQAGPRDLTTGFPLGGNFLFFNQTELRFPLIGDNIGGVLFHDFGNIYDTLNRFSLRQTQPNIHEFDYMVHAVGFGIRYRTPVGPLRVDLAYSINSPSFIGFKAANQQDLVNAGVNPCQTLPAQCVLQNTGHFQYFFSIGQTF